MIAWIVSAALLMALTLALLLWPLLRRRAGAAGGSRGQFALRVYRDQLAEVERDLERGVLRPDQAEAARTEVKRRMLAAADEAEPEKSAGEGPASTPPTVSRDTALRSWAVAVALALLVPAVAGLLYFRLGAPGSSDRPLAERQAAGDLASAGGDTISLEQAVQNLQERLDHTPGDVGGWYLLGRAYLRLGRYPDALAALRRAQALAPDEPELAGVYAEALIAAEGGRIGEEARAALQRVLVLDPLSPQARFLLALDRAQQGDLHGAMQGWTDLLAIAPPSAPWLATVREQLNQAGLRSGIDLQTIQPSAEARDLAARAAQSGRETPPPAASLAPGPTAEDMAAARDMTPAERDRMVRGMVDRLAARLRDNPDDAEGWRRLARAYDVLGEPDKAAEARARLSALERR